MVDHCQYEEDDMRCQLAIDYAFCAVSPDVTERDMDMCFICDKHKVALSSKYEGKGYVVQCAMLPDMGYED